MIAGRRLLARLDHVAPGSRRGGASATLAVGTSAMLGPAETLGTRAGRRHIEPPRIRRAFRDQAIALVGRQRLRDAGIERRPIGIARPGRLGFLLRDQAGDFRAALEARVSQALRRQFLDSFAIEGKMLRLPTHRRFPANPEPGEVSIDRGLEFRPASRRIDILDAQQKTSAGLTRQLEIHHRRITLAAMEIPISARRKTENGWRHVSTLVIAGLDPAIHQAEIISSRVCYDRRWMPGASPGMTP